MSLNLFAGTGKEIRKLEDKKFTLVSVRLHNQNKREPLKRKSREHSRTEKNKEGRKKEKKTGVNMQYQPCDKYIDQYVHER